MSPSAWKEWIETFHLHYTVILLERLLPLGRSGLKHIPLYLRTDMIQVSFRLEGVD